MKRNKATFSEIRYIIRHNKFRKLLSKRGLSTAIPQSEMFPIISGRESHSRRAGRKQVS